MAVTGVDHAALTVSDLARSVEFYRGAFGLRLLRSETLDPRIVHRVFGLAGVEVVRADLRAGRTGRLTLYWFASGGKDPIRDDFDRLGIQFVALSVDDLDDALGRVAHLGGEVLTEPASDRPGHRAAFVRDPDGAILQLLETPFSLSPVGRIYARGRRLVERLSQPAMAGTAVSRKAHPRQ
ncbi:VOC family protein [bacterium]|nr:VOC family protein [bacterium]